VNDRHLDGHADRLKYLSWFTLFVVILCVLRVLCVVMTLYLYGPPTP
jgi:hypothetical protein